MEDLEIRFTELKNIFVKRIEAGNNWWRGVSIKNARSSISDRDVADEPLRNIVKTSILLKTS
jgi:hypothetical protein